ncbi:MAG TPA: PQQ-binding-like beta-propeller repeat protein [Candidatus Baltobacteraceae bacterium]|nr:PQQ-binding-like beta-propeller repeat protein [Candidatus Baltobacteraceae bacterium]
MISTPAPTATPAATSTPNASATSYTNDDWTTFAHDFARTADGRADTGISTTSVARLALRWKITIPGNPEIFASPVVYDGNVIVSTFAPPATIYDFSAADGSLRWSFTMDDGSGQKTPTIDPANGLVFVGNARSGAAGILPSTEYALRLLDGSLVWRQTIPGHARATDVVANGVVYTASSGGDPPQCLNEGMFALDEATGAVKWSWYVNAAKNPGGGGAIWGPVGFDGSHLIFGTGNTCNTPVTTSNGAAALDLDGHLLWSMVAQPNSTLDYDTGSSVMVVNGRATFLNKNGLLYSVDAATGANQRSITANPNYGYGFWSSPSSDGTVTVVESGAYAPGMPTSGALRVPAAGAIGGDRFCYTFRRTRAIEPGYTSLLKAFDTSGTLLWSAPSQAIAPFYAAIDNGVVFADIDSTLQAFDLHTGAKLWSYPTAGLLWAGPVVVPSGVYAADGSGNVYAFAIPAPASSSARARPRR